MHARHGERVRADADEALELAGVRAHRGDLVLPVGLEAEEDAEADVVDARVERAVEAGDAPAEVALHGVGRVHFGIDLVVVGLLEDLERPDAGLVDDLEVVDAERGGVDVDAADLVPRARDAPRHLGRVDGGERVGDEARARHGMLAVDGHHALVADLDHRLRLAPDLVHREAAALLLVVVEREAAVAAAVHAVARDVHRREGHDAVVVDLVLHVPGRLGHLGQELGVVDGEQGGDLGAGERLDRERLLEDVADAGGVGAGVGGELGADLVVADEVAAAVAVAVDLVALDDRLGREPLVCLGHVVPSGGRPPRPGKWRASRRGVPEGADDSTPPVKRKAVVCAKRPVRRAGHTAGSTRARRAHVRRARRGGGRKKRPPPP